MPAIEMKPGIWWVGVNVRSHDLFEGLWPIPDGVSLNSYIVKGDKIAIIDLVREWSGSSSNLLQQLETAGIAPADVDYIVANHLEPDHSEFLRNFRRLAPRAEILASPKGIELAQALCGVTEGARAVADGEELDLGAGKKLVFAHIPFVHWPDTMVTYEPNSQVLFSCDAFGGFGALKGILYDDEVLPEDQDFYYREMLRYYANIVANFAKPVQRAIDKLKGIPVSVIAPSHGLVWRSDPGEVVQRYLRFAGYSGGQCEKGITLLWSSMYGNTKAVTDAVMRGVAREGVPMEVFEVPLADHSYILASVFKNKGIIVGAPTYEVKMFPPMAQVLDSIARKRMTGRKAFHFGSFGWSGGAQKEFETVAEELKWELSESLEFRGAPSSEDLSKAEDLAAAFARAIRDAA
ncbi:MAG: Anaerobic nitric oxide reductase flavorubredoxin [Chloroflexi bacterium ADurb.Bin180]|nr:MAG: Anaerobic nitric oxide reductase flavorubredoxin [Chloroflexi bacterium ADurb.Bin180]HNR95743.1 FprA family A-type flavoprotein [Anaerolineae bacterium]HNT05495.1 FprA family A-type flavoprotein [Anaerolineae bacterium]